MIKMKQLVSQFANMTSKTPIWETSKAWFHL